MQQIRNIAIIAHVDHGKTTLVDKMLIQAGTFRTNETLSERIMDSNDLERERGITILSKNASIRYKDTKINIIDTPGHSDFGGEVERVLKMVDGVLLVVDAFEGAMPQTRFVLKKALALDIKPIVVINKIDRGDARIHGVEEEVLSLFLELGASDDQFDFPVVYASAKEGHASLISDVEGENLEPLFESIIKHIPAPGKDEIGPFQMLVSSLAYDDYIGRIAIGRIERGSVQVGKPVIVIRKTVGSRVEKIKGAYVMEGLKRIETQDARAGDIVMLTGIADISIGDTICDFDNPEALDFVDIDEPTISMGFIVNNSPFAGKEGRFVTSRHLRERLFREVETNVSLKVEETQSPDSFNVSGRGELHLSILIETMRREGYEFQVSKPEVIYKRIEGELHEPYEDLYIDVKESAVGIVIEKLGARKAELLQMQAPENGFVKLLFKIPSRCLIGYRSEFMTDTKGDGIINHIFAGYDIFKGEISTRNRGSLVAFETGEATSYGLYNSQERGRLFIGPGTKVYKGMIIGENSRGDDMVINPCKKKHVTNIRASGSDDALKLSPPVVMSLEQALEFIAFDEYVEVTPKNIRLRKKNLDNDLRMKELNRAKRTGNG